MKSEVSLFHMMLKVALQLELQNNMTEFTAVFSQVLLFFINLSFHVLGDYDNCISTWNTSFSS